MECGAKEMSSGKFFLDYSERNNKIYLNSLRNNKDNHLSVNWGSKESQQKRFEILYDADKDFKNLHVLDVGCGLGHFADFLKDKDFQGIYEGADILPEMVEKAKKRNPDFIFNNKNIFDFDNLSYDYVVMSGIFTFANFDILHKVIREVCRVCKKGVAFNSLSAWSPKKEEGEFYADPIRTLELCSQLTSKVVLRHDYLPHDFTIYMYK